MEWVETTAKTIEEAKDLALDQLGVDEHDAEFEVVEEPRTGLFGRTRGEARVRARVVPKQPRPKTERRDRRGRSTGRSGRSDRSGGSGRGGRGQGSGSSSESGSGSGTDPAPQPAPELETVPAGGGGSRSEGRSRGGRARGGRSAAANHDQERTEMSETEVAAQGEVVRGFLLDLLDAFGLDGDVSATPAEAGAVELAVTGSDLGLLIGPKGQTLQAIQELSRIVLQRQFPDDTHARIRVDVGGYRERRREALARFTEQVAQDVLASGVQKAMEPMSPPDRKVVHDTVNEIDGVHTVSEGEDSRRRVVIIPD